MVKVLTVGTDEEILLNGTHPIKIGLKVGDTLTLVKKPMSRTKTAEELLKQYLMIEGGQEMNAWHNEVVKLVEGE